MNKITDLSQTVEFMISDDYRDRFIAEYAQVKIRYFKLKRYLEYVNNNDPEKVKYYNIQILEEQLAIMRLYIKLLVSRAAIENIILPEVEL